MFGERIWANSAVAGLTLVAALLIFPGFGDRYLWDDEAETALLAKNVLRFGVPVAWDGVNLVSQQCGAAYELSLAIDAVAAHPRRDLGVVVRAGPR